jgi:SAM-dependent methyltransferase
VKRDALLGAGVRRATGSRNTERAAWGRREGREMASDSEGSYARRAAEYIEQFGSTTSAHPSDVQLISSWAASVDGPLLDAGCGPGQWTAFLEQQGHEARGVDQVPEFVEYARQAHPDVAFTLGDVDALRDPAGSYGGVLAWYSLIHHGPDTIHRPLEEFARVLRPGGKLLVGFFVGAAVEPFEHAVVTAYRWPTDALRHELDAAGFDVVETHTRSVSAPKPRPHGAVVASLRATD